MRLDAHVRHEGYTYQARLAGERWDKQVNTNLGVRFCLSLPGGGLVGKSTLAMQYSRVYENDNAARN